MLALFECHKVMIGDRIKKRQIFSQVHSWTIDLRKNGGKPVTDRSQFSQEIAAGKQVCRCPTRLGG